MQGAEYDRLAAELRTALTSLEKREKVLKASEEKVGYLVAQLRVAVDKLWQQFRTVLHLLVIILY